MSVEWQEKLQYEDFYEKLYEDEARINELREEFVVEHFNEFMDWVVVVGKKELFEGFTESETMGSRWGEVINREYENSQNGMELEPEDWENK